MRPTTKYSAGEAERGVDRLPHIRVTVATSSKPLPVEALPSACLDEAAIGQLTQRNRSWQWNYGQKLPFTFECEDRFSWGEVQAQLKV